MKSSVRSLSARLSLAALVCAGASCGGPPPPQEVVDPAMSEPSPSPRPLFLGDTRRSTFGRLEIAYRTDPSPVPLNASFRLLIDVNDATDPSRPVDVVLASVTAEMPEHRHGMNVEPALRRLGPGRFEADGMLLHMLGRWLLRVDVVHRGITERADFDIVLR